MKKKIMPLFVLGILMVSVSFAMAATCPEGTEPVYMETVIVSSDGTTSSSVNALEAGKTYLLEVSGTADAGDTIEFDAKYSITHRISGDSWTDTVSGYESDGTDLLELKVNGNFVDWGAFNDEHLYSLIITGDGNPVEMQIYDIYYPNNQGSLTVNIS
ncbi:MAG: hypothetical protein PHV16_04180, partial [Candidatus Nanoarchaeia archaeon]|nr:hypothetical protein [Candidatus Nanoarchaeia archaeon]